MNHATAIHIARLFYNAAKHRFEAIVEFFAPGMPVPLRVPVRVHADQGIAHRQLTRALTQEAQRRGIGRL
ncbi:hypothetical protein BFP70_17610 [Thioclava sp. SK-1]|uniref:hypothetical protein n=1 Tax=Thioclava sp. SK-1 TaxID=1889770 RepID=UPI0008240FC9|nr:hypothetical protein [Thioclava sp. SK-1]OCX60428.1 hypothetical protein BFP70_17610 [Thioclava sp. SK-1]